MKESGNKKCVQQLVPSAQANNYRDISLSSVTTKLLDIILMQRLSPTLDENICPDFAQTDAIYATQETLLTHL